MEPEVNPSLIIEKLGVSEAGIKHQCRCHLLYIPNLGIDII
jgi:hypothetical protein